MTVFRKITHHGAFEKDLKKLLKRYPSLHDDLATFIKSQLSLYHKMHIDNNGIVPLSGYGITSPKLFKARKFACKSLKGKGANSGIRIIYAYFPDDDCVEFIEIYYKGDSENEDRQRILQLYKSA